MRNIRKTIVGFITVILFLTVCLSANAQQVTVPEPVTLAPVPLGTANELDRLDQLSMEVAYLKELLEKKTDKPGTNKGWSAPKIGGRFFMDSVTAMNQDWDGLDVATDNNVAAQNWFGFRDVRFTLTGTGYDFLEYKFELGFEKGTNYNAGYRDIYLGIQHVPILEYVRIGHQYVEEAGSEICNGTTDYTFMEAPSPPVQQFMLRRLGVTSRHLFADDRVRMFFGVYDATNVSDIHYQKDDNQGIVLNTRMTLAPVFCKDSYRLLLVGGYYNYVDSTSSRSLSFNRPGGWDVYTSHNLGVFYSDQYQKAGFEAICQTGRFCVQTDMFLQHYADVNDGSGITIGNQTNYGGFVMARLFLTRNDYRKYNLKSARWDGVEISRPFKFGEMCGVNWPYGCGAWEVAAMYGIYDSFMFSTQHWDTAGDDRMTNQQIGAALNWYWNPHVKWAVNYIHDMTDARYAGNSYHLTGDYLGMSCRLAF